MAQEGVVNNWRGKKVLVTGAGGFIGSHLAERLAGLGAQTRAFVRYTSRINWGLLEALPQGELDKIDVVTADLRDTDAVRRAVQGVDVIFHLAAFTSVPYSFISPREAIETNIIGTLNLLTAARENDVKTVVHISTSEVYGTAQYVPIDESHPLQAQSPYSASKIGAEKIAESFYRAYDLPIAIIRPFNACGPRQSGRNIIPTIIVQALTRSKVVLGSLRPTRDFTYVGDEVDAFLKVAESPRAVGEVINIGSSFEISMADLAQRIFSLMGKDMKVVSDPSRLRPLGGEVERLWCDNTKAKEILGWQPRVSLDEALKKTIEWIEDNMALYKPDRYI